MSLKIAGIIATGIGAVGAIGAVMVGSDAQTIIECVAGSGGYGNVGTCGGDRSMSVWEYGELRDNAELFRNFSMILAGCGFLAALVAWHAENSRMGTDRLGEEN